MFKLFRKRNKKSKFIEIWASDLMDFSINFIKNNKLDYTDSCYLFTDNGLFNSKNYNSGVDILLRKYLNNIYSSQKIGSHYAFCKEDQFSLSVSVDNLNGSIVAIIYISVFDSDIKDYKSYIYQIEYHENSRKIDKMYCNNQICSKELYLFLLNFIQKYGLYCGFFGKIHIGYKISLNPSDYSYSNL